MTHPCETIVCEALSEVTERDVVDLKGATLLDRDFDLDSVMFVHFLLALEDRVPGLHFDPDALAETAFNDVGLLLAHIGRFVPAVEGCSDAVVALEA